jgi:hypothetical protein
MASRASARGLVLGLMVLPLVARAHGGCAHPQGEEGWLGETRSPGLAAALSLTPMPVDLGNFYAESPGWGVAYTVVELGAFVPMMALAVDGGMHHANDRWTEGERAAFYGLLGGYVAVKAVAALHATLHARTYNTHVAAVHERALSVAPMPNGVALALRF